ncbi:transglutaminase-like domain-containing protein [Roseinatronobacter sp. NSM]|uniref:transglutaminase-like domain-containing protein n=1 Tax=Roseinatronobacter sp. NSM TaxID=3457785 RepID=UPI0040368437
MLHKLDFSQNTSVSEGYFLDSLLGLYLGNAARAVFARGRIVTLTAGQALPVQSSETLCILLQGVLTHDHGWLSPGCHFSDIAHPLAVKDAQALIWVLDMADAGWLDPQTAHLRAALDGALQSCARAIAGATPPRNLPDPETLCDVTHPAIRRTAARLLRTTEEATAQAVFAFVQAMPYRFGNWQERASDTLARGSGMCTTKANLQVALMRACGLEAGFAEVPMEMSVLGKLMPDAWLPMMRPRVRHYFGAVKLGGRWHAADSSYNDDSMRIYLEQIPGFDFLLPARIGTGTPYSPAHSHDGLDMFDIAVVPHLNDEMSKKSRFSPMQFEALNTRLDRAQGCWQKWLAADHPDLQGDDQQGGRVA